MTDEPLEAAKALLQLYGAETEVGGVALTLIERTAENETQRESMQESIDLRQQLLDREAALHTQTVARAEKAEALADGAIAAMSEYKNAVELCAVKMDERGRWVETKRYLDAKVAVEVALAKHAESKKVQP